MPRQLLLHDGLEKAVLSRMMATSAPVAQLDRVPDYESGGRTFESCRARHLSKALIAFLISRPNGEEGDGVLVCPGASGQRDETII